jgi:hypothetical protein
MGAVDHALDVAVAFDGGVQDREAGTEGAGGVASLMVGDAAGLVDDGDSHELLLMQLAGVDGVGHCILFIEAAPSPCI